jgi:hypothetical protein
MSSGAEPRPAIAGGYRMDVESTRQFLRSGRARFVTAALATSMVGCGARTELVDQAGAGGATATNTSSRASTGASTDCPLNPPPGPCGTWQPLAPSIVAAPPPSDVALDVPGAVEGPCGAVVAWYTLDTSGTGHTDWSTRAIGWSGAPFESATAHQSLSAATKASAGLSLALGPSGVGALESDETGCRFVALDALGHDQASGIELGTTRRCFGLAPRDEDWSFLLSEPNGLGPGWLDVLDPSSEDQTLSPLASPAERILWDRVVFDDGAFLTTAFSEDSATTVYADWLQGFDANGAALGPPLAVDGFDSAPVWLSRAGNAALAAWSDGGVIVVRPVDRSGAPAGPAIQYPSEEPIYGLSVMPAPDGDVLLVSTHLGADNQLRVRVRALAPDGSARGAPTEVGAPPSAERIFGAVSPSGERAILFWRVEDGVQATPLTCD